MKMPVVVFTGGLGNQLFQYALLHYISMKEDAKVELYCPKPKNDARGFNLDLITSFCPHISKIRKRRNIILDLLLKAQSFATHRELTWLSKILNIFICVEKSAYVIPNLQRHQKVYSGYFQNWLHVSKAFDSMEMEFSACFDHIRSKNPSLCLNNNYGVVHFRRGDLLSFRSSMGLLSKKYFLEAIEEAWSEYGKNIDIVILSDDKESAKTVFSSITQQILGPEDASEWEALALMDSAKFVITSNSTFSWWGAFLSHSKGGTAYIPHPWFLKWDPEPGLAFNFPGFKTLSSDFS